MIHCDFTIILSQDMYGELTLFKERFFILFNLRVIEVLLGEVLFACSHGSYQEKLIYFNISGQVVFSGPNTVR